MGREWKPGDVGITTPVTTNETATLFVVGDGPRFYYADGDIASHPPGADARPLVVIDPEDREQVERLTGCLAINGANANDRNYWRETQAALREFANPTPPKPDEPTGLGAVVECRAVVYEWVRGIHAGGGEWFVIDSAGGCRGPHRFVNIDPVKVLAEGVVEPCHCGRPTALEADPAVYADLGPAPAVLCERCLPVRCDAYPAACREGVIA